MKFFPGPELFLTCLFSLHPETMAQSTRAAEFSRTTTFKSVAAFEAAAMAFQPATHQSDLSALFTVTEVGQPEDPMTGTPVVAAIIKTSTTLWSNDAEAIVFVTASPPTKSTPASVGALFLLENQRGTWRIVDALGFSATGKYAEISAELTAYAGSGSHLGDEGLAPVITITESHGGRGYSYQSSASYFLNTSKLKRLKLNKPGRIKAA